MKAFALAMLLAATSAPERVPGRHSLVSARDPAVEITLPRAASYIGADRWVMFDVADCEVHLFAEADANRRIRRYYWLQFEGYLPSRPELHYTDPKQPTVRIGGRGFFVVTRAGSRDNPAKPGSDLDHVLKLVAAKGYTLPQDIVSVRLLHRLDETRRKELMIIYGEDLADSGATLAEVIQGDAYAPAWTPIAKAAEGRALERVRVRFTG